MLHWLLTVYTISLTALKGKKKKKVDVAEMTEAKQISLINVLIAVIFL